MEITPLGDCAVQIHLTKEDLSRYGFSGAELDLSDKKTRLMLLSLCESVRREWAFCKKDDRLLFQLFPEGKAGLELVISRADAPAPGRRGFRFSDFDSFAAALAGVDAEKVTCYRRKNGSGFLILPDENAEASLSEFAAPEKAPESAVLKTKYKFIPQKVIREVQNAAHHTL